MGSGSSIRLPLSESSVPEQATRSLRNLYGNSILFAALLGCIHKFEHLQRLRTRNRGHSRMHELDDLHYKWNVVNRHVVHYVSFVIRIKCNGSIVTVWPRGAQCSHTAILPHPSYHFGVRRIRPCDL